GSDEPGCRDRGRGRGLGPVDDRGAGGQRRQRAEARAVPAAGRGRPDGGGDGMTERENGTTTWLIRNATLPGGQRTDLLLRDGTIAAPGPRLSPGGAPVLHAHRPPALPRPVRRA